jgi:tetratricopeptide (TPR) repeat protein
MDPSAINQRQKLAEMLVKAGRIEDARVEFETIGKHYSANGFYLKAIAVYKQLQKLFPGDNGVTLTLAGLNEKHGLVGNALAEYKQVYDYYEKSSDMEEALKILDRMQSVDPLNINIKLKLAESYLQAGRKDEAYSTFRRLALLIQERGDVAAFSRLDERVRQLFPDKTAFMLDVLAEQVEEGNAASAANGIQALLRGNPNDKRVWELIVKAYRKLGQSQRVKVACQHYLRFFPHELSPRKGLLECLVSERNVKEALNLLEQYEQDFIQAGAAADLVATYLSMDEIDPVNLRLLEGLKRAYDATGDEEGAAALEPRLASFKTVSGQTNGADQPASAGVRPDDPENLEDRESDRIQSAQPAQEGEPGDAPVEPSPCLEAVPAPDEGSQASEEAVLSELDPFSESCEDEIEIEIEIDGDPGFEAVDVDGEQAVPLGDNWLESVDDIFDSIAATPRGVKFGSDLDTSDARTHYDLGIAFKEMGLYDEAISEFRQAAVDSARKVECRVLQAACLREKGDPATAENVLRSLLHPGMSLEEACSVKYELALACEALGKSDEAAALLTGIDASNPGFRDVRSRLDVSGNDNSLDFSDEELQGFELK